MTALFERDRPYVIVLGGEFAEAPGPNDTPPLANGMFDGAYDLDPSLYDVHMYDEDNVANGTGDGFVFDQLLIAINSSYRPLRIAVAGHSHGGGSVADLCQRLVTAQVNDETTRPFEVILTMYVDAVEQGTILPEWRRPAGSQHHVNLFQSVSDTNPDGMPVANSNPDWDVNIILNCVNGIGHTEIDNCEVVHNILSDRLDYHSYSICMPLEAGYCDDGVACN